MIVENKKSWLGLILAYRGSVLPRIWRRLLATTAFAAILTALHYRNPTIAAISLTPLPFTLVGLALGIFLGFRNNTSYDRFWEGRKLWGGIVNATRSLTRKTLTLVSAGGSTPSEEQRGMVYRIIAYTHCLRLHLRDVRDNAELERLLPAEEVQALATETNRPVAILQGLGDRYARAWHSGRIDTFHLPELERGLTELTALQGGCERIKATPIPYSYTVLIHRIVAFYCFTLPLGIVDTVKQVTPLVVLLVSYAFLGLDAIGDEIEEPFGTDMNDLPLGQLSRMIEVNLRERLGESPVPPLAEPEGGVMR